MLFRYLAPGPEPWSVKFAEISPTRVVYPDNWQVKFILNLFLFLCCFCGGSVEGVRRGSPWTRSVWGSMDRGSVFSGHPLHKAKRSDVL